MIQFPKLLARTFEYTEKNHLKIKFSSSDYMRAPGAEYIVTAGRPRRRVELPCLEAQLAAKKIWKAAGGRKIYLCLSGGIDSEAMAEAFIAAKVPFTAVILEFSAGLNEFDIIHAKSFVCRNGLRSKILQLDILNFFISNEYLKIAKSYELVSPQLCAHIWLLEQLKDGVPVLAGNPPFGSTKDSRIYRPLLPSEKYFAPERYFRKNKLPGVAFFFLYTPELIYSFFQLESLKAHLEQLLRDEEGANLLASYATKCSIYKESGFQAEPRENKFTGFEMVKKRFHELLGGSEDVFNERYRYPLEDMFPAPTSYTSVLPLKDGDFFQLTT